MKKILFIVFVICLLTGCKNEREEWEYQILKIEEEQTLQDRANDLVQKAIGGNSYEARMPRKLEVSQYKLNQMGKEGWELVAVYTTIETNFPNFGDAEYHTGIKPNTRTESLNFVFKRRK